MTGTRNRNGAIDAAVRGGYGVSIQPATDDGGRWVDDTDSCGLDRWRAS